MALSSIQGQTSVGATKPDGLVAAIPIEITAPRDAPEGYSVSVAGRNTAVQEGTYCIVFNYGVPAGKRVDPTRSGSEDEDGRSYDGMLVTVVDDATQRSANSDYWEVWFTEDDVNGSGWSSEVKMKIGDNDHIWVLSKRRTGEDL